MKGTGQVAGGRESQQVDDEDGCGEVDSRVGGVGGDGGVVAVSEMVGFVARVAWKVLSWEQ